MPDGSTPNELPATASDARSAIARTLASTLHVRDVLANVAAATRPLIPFERMGIALLEDADTVRSFLMIGDGADQLSEQVRSRAQCSDKLWPRLGSPPICIRDSAQELDTA
jgi:hypothetical protein